MKFTLTLLTVLRLAARLQPGTRGLAESQVNFRPAEESGQKTSCSKVLLPVGLTLQVAGH